MRRLPYNKALTPRAQALRTKATPAERKLWSQFLSPHPARWLRQRPIANFIVDFYCAQGKLGVELDGAQHYTPDGLIQDAERTKRLEHLGVHVIRFENQAVMRNFSAVCQEINRQLEQRQRR